MLFYNDLHEVTRENRHPPGLKRQKLQRGKTSGLREYPACRQPEQQKIGPPV